MRITFSGDPQTVTPICCRTSIAIGFMLTQRSPVSIIVFGLIGMMAANIITTTPDQEIIGVTRSPWKVGSECQSIAMLRQVKIMYPSEARSRTSGGLLDLLVQAQSADEATTLMTARRSGAPSSIQTGSSGAIALRARWKSAVAVNQ